MEVAKRQEPLSREERPEGVSDKEWAVLVYTDEMTRKVEVADETFALVRGLFNDQEVVEITATVGAIPFPLQMILIWLRVLRLIPPRSLATTA